MFGLTLPPPPLKTDGVVVVVVGAVCAEELLCMPGPCYAPLSAYYYQSNYGKQRGPRALMYLNQQTSSIHHASRAASRAHIHTHTRLQRQLLRRRGFDTLGRVLCSVWNQQSVQCRRTWLTLDCTIPIIEMCRKYKNVLELVFFRWESSSSHTF